MENHFWATENFFISIGQRKTISGRRKTILVRIKLGHQETISGRRKTF